MEGAAKSPLRGATQSEWLLIEPHVSRLRQAQENLGLAIHALAPEPGLTFDVETRLWLKTNPPPSPDGSSP